MKLKKRQITALLLALAMTLSLAACGGDNGNNESQAAEPKTDTSSAPAVPELVYTAKFTELDSTDRETPWPQVCVGGGYYATRYDKVGENRPEGAEEEYEGQYDIYETRLLFVSSSGEERLLENYSPLPAAENTEGKRDFKSGSNFVTMLPGRDGNLVVIENTYSNWYDGPDGVTGDSEEYWNYYQSNEQMYIRTLAGDGSELSSALLENAEWLISDPDLMQVDELGNMLSAYDRTITATAPDGSTAYVIESENYFISLIRFKDGRIAALTDDMGSAKLSILDPQAQRFVESIRLPDPAFIVYSGAGEYDLFYTIGDSFYGYSIETQSSEKLLDWAGLGVNTDAISGLAVAEDGSIICVTDNWDSVSNTSTREIVNLSLVPADSVQQKTVLTLGGMYVNSMSDMVAEFNRSNDRCRIELLDYSEAMNVSSEAEHNAAMTKLTTEIVAGNMPDILYLNQLPYAQLAAKGLLEDLYPYIDADSEFGREDFFSNILEAQEIDGKLYQICGEFELNTVIGSSSVVGDTPGWTFEQFKEALSSMPEGCEPFDAGTTKMDVLRSFLYYDMDSFVDWAAGECYFDSPEFIEVLNFANSFPANGAAEGESTAERIASGRQMLVKTSIGVLDQVKNSDAYFGGGSTYIGFPTGNGVGNTISIYGGYAMSANCADKEGAWQFLRTFFTDEYQKNIFGLPVSISAMEKKLNAEPAVLSEEQAASFLELVTGTTKLGDFNSSIVGIVTESAEPFFAGQRSAEEAAKLIQGKANIYVNEQR